MGSDNKDTVIVNDFLRLDLRNSLDNNAFKPIKNNEVKPNQQKVVALNMCISVNYKPREGLWEYRDLCVPVHGISK